MIRENLESESDNHEIIRGTKIIAWEYCIQCILYILKESQTLYKSVFNIDKILFIILMITVRNDFWLGSCLGS